MAIDDPDYQRFPYVFGTVPGWGADMTEAIREAARATLGHCIHEPINLLEVGVWEGRSACWLLDNVLTHPEATYTGIDTWPPEQPSSIYPTMLIHIAYHGSKARIIRGDSKVEVPRLTQRFQVVIVDGDHTYEGCYADLNNCWEKLLPSGIMICDDYAFPGLPGVPKAIDQFLGERSGQLVVLHKEVALAFRKIP